MERLATAFPCIAAGAALALPVTGCGSGDDATAPATPSSTTRVIERPLRLPDVARGGICPISLALSASLLPGRPSAPEAGLGPGLRAKESLDRLRRGPVYLVLPGIPRVTVGLPTTADRRLGEGWGSSPALVLARGTYRGRLVLRGDRIDGRGALRFGPGENPADRLELPAGPWRAEPRSLRRWGVELTRDGRWRAWPTTLRSETAGCYGIQVDGRTFSYPVVLSVGQSG